MNIAGRVTTRHPKLVHALRVVGYIVLALVVVVANLVAGAFLYLKTNRAREQLLAFGLKKLGPIFPGGITVGGSEGDLTRGIVLRDIVLRDLDGRPAVEVRRLEVGYSLGALILTRVQVDRVAVDGATVTSQPLADGRDNLATIADVKLPKLPQHTPVSVMASDVVVQARFIRGDQDVRAVIALAGGLSHGMVARLDRLRVDLVTPTHAQLTAAGAAHIAAPIDLRHVRLRVDGDTTELRRSVEQVKLSGPAHVAVDANGRLDDLVGSLRLDTHQPKVEVSAGAHLHADRVEVSRLVVSSPFAHVDAAGLYRFDRTGHAKAHLDASDLGPLALFGAPKLSGTIKLDAVVDRDAHKVSGQVTGQVRNFRMADKRVARVDLHAQIVDLSGHVKVDARDIALGAIALRTAKIAADGDAKGIRVTVDGHGTEGIDLQLAALAVPRLYEQHLLGIEASIDRVRLRAGGSPWQEDHPAHVSADFGTGTYALSPLGLSNHTQHLTVEGRLMGKMIEDVHVDLEHFDLSQLPSVLSPGHVLPHTDLQAKLEAHGTTDQPTVGASFSGTGDGRTNRDLIHFTANGDGRLDAGRLDARAFATIGGQKVSGAISLPIPLRPNQPVEGSVNASVLLNPWFADLLVPKAISSQPILLYTLGAKVTAQGQLSGTTSDPKINASARVARWGADNAHGNFGISMEYGNKKLATSSTLTLSSLPEGGGSAAGVVEATAELPIDLAPSLSGTSGQLFDRHAAWSGAVNLKHIDISRLPFEALNLVPLVRHGTVDGSAQLSGSYDHPKAIWHSEGRDLDWSGMNQVGIVTNGKLDGVATTADLTMTVRGNEALRAQGSISDGRTWREAPLAATIDVPGFDLTRVQLVKEAQGILTGSAKITGSWAHPNAVADAHVAGLRTGPVAYQKMDLKGTVKDHKLAVAIDAQQTNGSSLVGRAELPLDGGTMAGLVEASHFRVELVSELLPHLRVVRGELDGKLTLAGTTQKPELHGALALAHGEAVLSSTAIGYRDISARLGFDRDVITVEGLQIHAAGGTLDGHGRLTLRDLRPESWAGELRLRRYPLQWDTTMGLADATVSLDGHRKQHGFATEITLAGARVDLQDDHALHGLIPTARLEDVKVGKARPQPIAIPLDNQPKVTATDGKSVTLLVKGPFMVHSAELDLGLRADVKIDLGSDIPTAAGVLAFTPHGVVRLFGQTYDLDRGRIVFGNIAQPYLDLRLARQTPRARIGVDLGGSARQPTLQFWSTPPAYSATEVAALVTGQPQHQGGVAKQGLDDKVAGPISNLIAMSFRQTDPASANVDVTRPQPAPNARNPLTP